MLKFSIKLPIRFPAILLGLSLSLLILQPAQGDDIDVFTAGLGAAARPNILFVLDYSGSMGNSIEDLVKADILRNAVSEIVSDNADKIAAGVLMYSKHSTGVKWPVTNLNGYANNIDSSIPVSGSLRVKNVLANIVQNYPVGGSTNTVGALMEAALYYQGENVSVGGIDKRNTNMFEPQTWDTTTNQYTNGSIFAAIPSSYRPTDAFAYNANGGAKSYCKDFSGYVGANYCSDLTVDNCVYVAAETTTDADGFETTIGEHQVCEYTSPNKWNGANYKSPIIDECQSNFIVLVSDGQPTVRTDSKDLKKVMDVSPKHCTDLSTSIFESEAGTMPEGNCGPEIVRALNENDQVRGIDNSTVSTFTIGFDVDGPGKEYLKLLAAEGDGEFFSASKPEDLSMALESIISDILGFNENFSELSIDVNKATFSHDNRAFFPLFKPSFARSWNGNLKGYFIDRDGLKDINSELATITDDAGTRFTDTAQSFWSADPDGNEVELGGAGSRLGDNRTIFTFTNGTPDNSPLDTENDSNLLVAGSPFVSAAMVGVPGNDTERDTLIDWLHEAPIGDALHTKPTSLRYPNSLNLTYLMTNQGLLHAFNTSAPTDPAAADSSGGAELYAFIPPELLPNLTELTGGSSSSTGHIYGLDGGLTPWHDDLNNDGIVNDNETALLIFGMRRGGNNYYALDVSDPLNPIYKWKIEGGVAPFNHLAQSWSRMSLITVKKGTGTQKLLAFGGGYDAATLDGTSQRTEATGNVIYFIDQDGDAVWTATDLDMDYSIPSDLTPIDSDNDGNADRIYVGDTGGQIWRLDFPDIEGTKTITRLADIGDDTFQPFFYPPSIALNNRTSTPYLSVSIGSGNRTKPLRRNSQNYIYMIKDHDIAVGAPADTTVYTEDDLYNATNNDVGSDDPDTVTAARDLLKAKKGWYLKLAKGEKALSKILIFENQILATTFSPSGAVAPDACGLPATAGRYYAMNLQDARPVDPLGDDSDPAPTRLTASHRHKVISTVGIPSSPIVVFPKGSGVVQIVVDKQTVDTIDQRLHKLLWIDRE